MLCGNYGQGKTIRTRYGRVGLGWRRECGGVGSSNLEEWAEDVIERAGWIEWISTVEKQLQI